MMLEETIEDWVVHNASRLGLSNLRKIERRKNGRHGWFPTYGDLIGLKDNRTVRIEIETATSGFFIHKKEVRDRIDVLITANNSVPRALAKRRELKTKIVIDLWQFPEFRSFVQKEVEDVFGQW